MQPQQPMGFVDLTLQGSVLTANMIPPEVSINGYRIPASYGLQRVPMPAGPVHIEALKRLGIQVTAVCGSAEKAKAMAGLWGIPGVLIKLVVLGLLWAYLHHLFAGIRHLLMDMNHDLVTKEFGKSSAVSVLVGSISVTVVLGAKLFGLY